MSYISPQGEQSTTSEIALLARLNTLATTPAGFAIAKNADGTFSNVSLLNVANITVAQGGTGVTSFTPNALLVANTTSTGALTQVPVGNPGQVLTSNGSNLPPTFQSTGSGTVTSVSVVTNQGVSGSVATATTTPAITLTLGALTGVTSLNGLVVTANTGVVTTGTWNASVIGPAYGGTGVANNVASTLAISGSFATTLTVTGVTGVTLPTSGTLATLAGSEALTNKSVNGMTITASTGTFTLTNLKTLTVSDSTTLATAAITLGNGKVLTISNSGTLQGGDAFVLSIAASKTVTFNKSITFDGTDSTTMTFPSTSATIARTDAANTFTGTQTITTIAGLTTVTGAASNMTITAGTGASRTLILQTTTSGSAATTALTLNADQSATFAAGASFGGNISGSGAWTVTGGAGNMTIVSGTGNSRTMILQTTTSGGAATTSLTLNADQTATFAAGVTVGGTLALGANSITMSGSIGVTGTRVTKGWFTDVESTNVPTVGGVALPTLAAGQTWTGQNKFNNLVDVNNAIAASSNAATVPVTFRLNTVTNNSAATLTITMTTTSAVDGQMTIVRILDSSAAAQTITWVNTENSTVSAPVTSNGSTTLFLTVGFIYNSGTSKWRCIASA